MHATRELTTVERETSECDHRECPAAAGVRVVLPDSKDDLVFCMHHLRYRKPVLHLPEGSYVEVLDYH